MVDSPEGPVISAPPKKGMTRRQALKVTGAAAAGALLGAFHVDIAAETGKLGLEYLGTQPGREQFARMASDFDKKSNERIAADPRHFLMSNKLVEPNPYLRPPLAIIQEAVELYKNKTGKMPFFQKLIAYKPLSFYTEALKSELGDLEQLALKKDTSLQSPDFFLKRINKIAGPELALYIHWSQYPAINYADFGTLPDSSLFDVMMMSLREQANTVAYKWYDKHYYANRMNSPDSDVKPISSARILTYFIEENLGKIDKALWDTAILLKAMARMHFEGPVIDGNYAISAVETTALLVRDEFSVSGNLQLLTTMGILDPDIGMSDQKNIEISVVNRAGVLYHAMNIVALLSACPSEIIMLGTLKQQTNTYRDQGNAKVASDLLVAANLKEVEAYLDRLSHVNPFDS